MSDFNLCAYFDESQDKSEKVHAIGGFIAPGYEWEALQDKWIARLKPTGVSAFHMTDCECGYREFSDTKGWKPEDRKQLIKDLIEIICRYRVLMVGCGIILDDYKQLPTENGKLGIDEWHLSFQYVLQETARQATPFGAEETVAFFFDWKDKQGNAKDLFFEFQQDNRLEEWHSRLGTITFGHKEFGVPGSIPLLQVADVAAYETRKAIANPITHPHLPERKSLTALRKAEAVGSVSYLENKVLKNILQLKREENEQRSRGAPTLTPEPDLR